MLKIDRKLSVYISLVLTAVMFIGTVAMALYMPTLLDYLLSRNVAFASLAPFGQTMVFIAAYAEIALMLFGLGMLFALLLLVHKKRNYKVVRG